MPAFIRFPQEAAIIGRLLAGYGELEFELSRCLGAALGDDNTAARALFRVRGEKQRILTADALMRHKYHAADLETRYSETIACMHWCRTARNQYAVLREVEDLLADRGKLLVKPYSGLVLGHHLATALGIESKVPKVLLPVES